VTKNLLKSSLLLFPLLGLATWAAPAHATEVTYQVVGGGAGGAVVPSGGDLQIGRGYKLKIYLQRDTGTWTAATVSLGGELAEMKKASFPVGGRPIVFQAIAPTTASYTPVALPAIPLTGYGTLQRETPVWSFANQSLSLADTQELELWFAFDSQTTLDGTPVSFTIDFAGTRNGAPVTASATFTATARGNSPLTIAAPFLDSAAMTLGGVPGLRVRHRISLINGTDASDSTNTAQIAFRPVGPDGESMRVVATSGAKLKPFRMFSGKLANYYYDTVRFLNGAPQVIASGNVLAPLSDAPYPPREPTWIGMPTTFQHRLNVNNDPIAVALVEEDLTAPSQVSLATQNQTLVRRTFGGADGTAYVHGYDGVGDYSVLDVFIACADLEGYAPTNPDYQITLDATAWDRQYDGTARSRPATLTVVLPTASFLSCDGGTGVFRKDPEWNDSSYRWFNGRSIGVGARADFPILASLPVGAANITDFAIIDRLPISDDPRATSFQTYGLAETPQACGTGLPACPDGGTCIAGQCPGAFGVRVYYCESATDFDHDDVSALITATTCQPAVIGSLLETFPAGRRWAPPAGMTPTHVVWYAPTFAPRPGLDEFSSGSPNIPAYTLGVSVTTKATTPVEMRNTAWFGASFTAAGEARTLSNRAGRLGPGAEPATNAVGNRDAEVDDALEDDGWYRVVNFQCLYTELNAAPDSLIELDDPVDRCTGASFRVYRRDSSPPSTGVVLRLDVPDGVEVTNVVFPISTPTCTIVQPALTDRPMVWEFNGCEIGASEAQSRVDIAYCLDPDYPFVDGDPVTLALRVTEMDFAPLFPLPPGNTLDRCNSGTGGPDNGNGIAEPNESGHPRGTSTVKVLGRQTFALAPSCEDDDEPAFQVELGNPSGKPLTGLVAEIGLPVGTTFDGVSGFALEPPGPSAGTFEVDLGMGFVPLAGVAVASWPAIEAVRWVGGTTTLAAYGGRVTFVVHVKPLDGEEGPFFASGVLDSNELPATNGTAIPYVLNDCQPLTVQKFFDADADGTRDPGEPTLQGWDFTVTRLDTQVLVTTLVTGADGTASVRVQSGAYIVTELDPVTSGSPSWRLTTPNDVLATVASPTSVQFGNVCECDSPSCTTAACTPNLAVPRGANCGAAEPIECDDDDLCTIDVCNAGSSSCDFTEVGCLGGLQPGFFASVKNQAGVVVGAIRCVTNGGQVQCTTQTAADGTPIDADGDGRPELAVFPEWADACVGIP